MTTTIDTSVVDQRDRGEFWRATVCGQFAPLHVIPRAEDPHGHVVAGEVGDLQLRQISAGAHTFDRSPALIKASDEDYYKVVLGVQGSTLVVQDGREAVVRAGDLALYDSTRPYTFAMDGPFDLTVCMLPKRRLAVRADQLRAVTAIRIDGASGMGALAGTFLADVFRRCDEFQPAEHGLVVDTVAQLMSALVRGAAPGVAPGNVHLARARAYIDAHLSDTSLCPESAAAATGVSLSYLHKLFARTDITAAGYIRERRLQGCWADLRSDRYAALTITAIGARWGLPDSAQVSRMFKARFGISPAQHRTASNSRHAEKVSHTARRRPSRSLGSPSADAAQSASQRPAVHAA